MTPATGGSALRHPGLWLLASLAAALLLALLARHLPAPLPADAPAQQFSAVRAMQQVARIAAEPHPIGSPALARVREYLVGELHGLGLPVEVQTGIGQAVTPGVRLLTFGQVSNIIATLPGSDPALPALVAMAHYDTVPHSPGAGDDSAGVAALLEAARALATGPRLARDVVFLLTDGEEAGLLGAQRYFDTRPADSLAAVINLEARGSGGRAMLFETSPAPSGLIAAYRRAAPLPASDASAALLYRIMGHGTDFSHALDAGVPGLNFALLGRPAYYHSAASTPETLDPRSLQHMGDQALALLRTLAGSRETIAARDTVWFDLQGWWLVQYPPLWGWLPLLLAAALLAPLLRARTSAGPLRATLTGAGRLLMLAGLPALAVQLLHTAALALSQPLGGHDWLSAHIGLYGVACVTLALGLILQLMRRLDPDPAGLLAALWLLAALAQLGLPETAYLLAWPLLVATLMARIARTPWHIVLLLPLAVLAAGWVATRLADTLLALGTQWPGAAMPLLALALLPLLPLCRHALHPAGTGTEPRTRRPVATRIAPASGLAVALAGALLMLSVPLLPARLPASHEVFLVIERDTGRSFRASFRQAPDRWSLAMLSGEGRPVRRQSLPPPASGEPWLAVTATPPSQAPVLALTTACSTTDTDTTLHLLALPANGGHRLRLALKPSVRLAELNVNGQQTRHQLDAGHWTVIDFQAVPDTGLRLSFQAGSGGSLDARVMELRNDWMPGASYTAPPPGSLPWQLSGSSLIIDSAEFRWPDA